MNANELKLLQEKTNDQDLLMEEIRVKMADASTHSESNASHTKITILVDSTSCCLFWRI